MFFYLDPDPCCKQTDTDPKHCFKYLMLQLLYDDHVPSFAGLQWILATAASWIRIQSHQKGSIRDPTINLKKLILPSRTSHFDTLKGLSYILWCLLLVCMDWTGLVQNENLSFFKYSTKSKGNVAI